MWTHVNKQSTHTHIYNICYNSPIMLVYVISCCCCFYCCCCCRFCDACCLVECFFKCVSVYIIIYSLYKKRNDHKIVDVFFFFLIHSFYPNVNECIYIPIRREKNLNTLHKQTNKQATQKTVLKYRNISIYKRGKTQSIQRIENCKYLKLFAFCFPNEIAVTENLIWCLWCSNVPIFR